MLTNARAGFRVETPANNIRFRKTLEAVCTAEDAHLVAAIRTHIATYATSTLACIPDVWHAQPTVLVSVVLLNAWNTTSSSTTACMSNRRSFNARVFPIARAVAAIRAYGTCTSCDNDGWRLEWLYATIPQYVLCAWHWVFAYLNCVEILFLDMA